MPKAKIENTAQESLDELKIKLAEIRLKIKAGHEKNTNAHKKIKKQIAQHLTKSK
ncbi:MAG TPA: 50S ribosomal protein L29 [Candidatus Woesebacteria bacterium]|nr:50S ribosomal protein L29 [Candidatus Woesebacteria bacterium]